MSASSRSRRRNACPPPSVNATETAVETRRYMSGVQPQEAATTLPVAVSSRRRARRHRASVGPARRQRCSTALCIELNARQARSQPSLGSAPGDGGGRGARGGRGGAGFDRCLTRFSSTARSAISISAAASAMCRSRSVGESSGGAGGGALSSARGMVSTTGSAGGSASLFCWAELHPGPTSAPQNKIRERCKAGCPGTLSTNRHAWPSPCARLASAGLRSNITRWG